MEGSFQGKGAGFAGALFLWYNIGMRKNKNKRETNTEKNYVLGALRLAIGWIFLWPFFDKLFGLGFSTVPGKAWMDGASPTVGFLKFATKGPFAHIFKSLAGNAWVDWLFMLGLLFIGLALIYGILIKLSAMFGSIMLFFMWLAALLPEHNPLIDEHIIYIVVLIMLAQTKAGESLGFGNEWSKFKIVKKYPILQ